MAMSAAIKDFSAVHMTWGAANELSAVAAYRRLAQMHDHPALSPLLQRIAQQETRHVAFYTTSFTIGASLSFWIGGQLDTWLHWRTAVAIAGAGVEGERPVAEAQLDGGVAVRDQRHPLQERGQRALGGQALRIGYHLVRRGGRRAQVGELAGHGDQLVQVLDPGVVLRVLAGLQLGPVRGLVGAVDHQLGTGVDRLAHPDATAVVHGHRDPRKEPVVGQPARDPEDVLRQGAVGAAVVGDQDAPHPRPPERPRGERDDAHQRERVERDVAILEVDAQARREELELRQLGVAGHRVGEGSAHALSSTLAIQAAWQRA